MLTDHRKFVAWLAWSLCLVCVGLALCTLLLYLLNGRTLVGFFRERDGAVMVLVICFSVVGALIVSHRPENPIGWIFCAAALFSRRSLRSGSSTEPMHSSPDPVPSPSARSCRGWSSGSGRRG